MQLSRESRSFIVMMGKGDISKVVSHRAVYSHALVVSYGLNEIARPISGIFEVNRRVKIHLLSIALGVVEVRTNA